MTDHINVSPFVLVFEHLIKTPDYQAPSSQVSCVLGEAA